MEKHIFDSIIEAIYDTLQKGKKNRKVRICQHDDTFVVLKTSKLFYNHCRNSKTCKRNHLSFKLKTLDEDLLRFYKQFELSSKRPKLRKVRNDTGKYHLRHSRSAQLSNPTSDPQSFLEDSKGGIKLEDHPDSTIPENLISADVPSISSMSFEEEEASPESDCMTQSSPEISFKNEMDESLSLLENEGWSSSEDSNEDQCWDGLVKELSDHYNWVFITNLILWKL